MWVVAFALLATAAAQTSPQPPQDAGTCISDGTLAGIVFGSIFGTLVIAVGIGFLLWTIRLRRAPPLKVADSSRQSAVTAFAENGRADAKTGDGENGNGHTGHSSPDVDLSGRSRGSRLPGLLRRKSPGLGSLKSVQGAPGVEVVRLESSGFGGLGFGLTHSGRDGLCLTELSGAAAASGRLGAGDRLLGVRVDLDGAGLADATAILSYAAAFPVTLEVRKAQAASVSEAPKEKAPLNLSAAVRSPRDAAQGSFGNSLEEVSAPQTPESPLHLRHEGLHEEPTSPMSVENGNFAATSRVLISDELSESPDPPVTVREKQTFTSSASLSFSPPQSPPPPPDSDPYAALSPKERLELMRLSYEDPSLSQSTPNILDAVAASATSQPSATAPNTARELKGKGEPASFVTRMAQSFEGPTAQPTPRNGSVSKDPSTDNQYQYKSSAVIAAVSQPGELYAHRADPVHENSGLRQPNEAAGLNSELYSRIEDGSALRLRSGPFVIDAPMAAGLSPSQIDMVREQRRASVLPSAASSPRGSRDESEAEGAGAIEATRAALRPAMATSNWLKTREASDGGAEVARLEFYQAQLARQHEELTRMGLQVPPPSK